METPVLPLSTRIWRQSNNWHARCQEEIRMFLEAFKGHAAVLSCPPKLSPVEGTQVLFMQSWMKNQRSSPANPFAFTSLRQALSLGLLVAQVAFISFSLCIVSLALPGFASVAAGAAVWAE